MEQSKYSHDAINESQTSAKLHAEFNESGTLKRDR